MKTLTFSLLMTFCTLFSFGQNLSEPATSLASTLSATAPVYISADRAQYASIEKTTSTKDAYMDAFRESRVNQCARAQKIKTVGIVLSAVGGSLLIGGAVMIAVGVRQETNYNNSYNSYYGYNTYTGPDGTGLLIGGVFCTLVGVGTTGAGIPLAIIGAVKARKYCGGDEKYRDRSYMELSTKGNGLALNF